MVGFREFGQRGVDRVFLTWGFVDLRSLLFPLKERIL